MKVMVLGAGVIGVTTAYYLAKAGHEVEVIERCDGPAAETSFANAGQVSPGYSAPWAGPGVPLKALKWLAMRHGPLVVRPGIDPAMLPWLFAMLRNCTSARYAVNKARMVPLAEYSRDCLRQLRADTGIVYDERSLGTLQLFRSPQQLDAAGNDIEVLRQFGVSHQLLDRDGCIASEPALAHARVEFIGGLRLPEDETGDCHLFTTRLAEVAATLGVRFSYGTELTEITVDEGKVTGVMTSCGHRVADACILALGSFTPAMVKRLGVKIPLYPVKGYSLTMPIADAAAAPISTIMDETYKVAITRLGIRIRVGGTAELSGFDTALKPGRRAALVRSFMDLFPSGGRLEKATFWCGLRPMTPDGPPIIGATLITGLFLNTGHGTLGWTMACGSARMLADIVSNKPAEISAQGLSIDRFAA